MNAGRFKKNILPFFLSLEVLIFVLYYCCGPQGLRVIYAMQHENKVVQESIVQLQETMQKLEEEKKDFLKYPFYREQIAREQLQMMKPGEEIYLYRSQ